METVTSKDGTVIAFDRSGSGPAVILVAGALGTRSKGMDNPLITSLSPHFTVIDYDRRGRGDSGDTLPYAVEREIEDIDALIDAAGGSASLYGLSSGAVLALEAADKLRGKVKKLAMYEPPFLIDSSRPPVPDDYVEQLNRAVAAGQRGDAVEIFMTKAILIPGEFVRQMRYGPTSDVFGSNVKPPEWAEMEQVAHTLAYDGLIMGDTMSGKPLPAKKWASVTCPTLVIVGGASESFFHNGAQALVDALPHAQRSILAGQNHAVDPAALAPVLINFFKA